MHKIFKRLRRSFLIFMVFSDWHKTNFAKRTRRGVLAGQFWMILGPFDMILRFCHDDF